MINKKNLLGKTPHELGAKDAIHTAIVAVRAACLIEPGARCGLNEHREAKPDAKGCGVADPFLKESVTTGKVFWLLLNQDEVPNVQHVWEHPTVDFSPPDREVKRNETLAETAKDLGVSYEQLMEAMDAGADGKGPPPYPGTLSGVELQTAQDCLSKGAIWSEYADETGHEFPDYGTACCPEYEYPSTELFKV